MPIKVEVIREMVINEWIHQTIRYHYTDGSHHDNYYCMSIDSDIFSPRLDISETNSNRQSTLVNPQK
jgi:hypothetical protein